MFSFFRRLTKAEAEAARLKQETDFYRAAFDSAREENLRLVKKCESETRASRKYEGELINAFLSALGEKGQRIILPTPRFDTPAQEIEVEKPQDDIEFDKAVKQTVDAFIEDGIAKGRTYDDAELMIIEGNIRQHPEQFGI